MGIEPTYQAWEARILPMNYARIFLLYHVIMNVFRCNCIIIVKHRFLTLLSNQEIQNKKDESNAKSKEPKIQKSVFVPLLSVDKFTIAWVS